MHPGIELNARARAFSMNITQKMLVDIGRPGPLLFRQLAHVDGRSHLGICVSAAIWSQTHVSARGSEGYLIAGEASEDEGPLPHGWEKLRSNASGIFPFP